MREITDDEYRRFLTTPARTAKVATVRAHGRPHVAPVWVALDGETILFTTGANSAKAADLRRDARVSLCVDDEAPPFAYVIVEGTAVLIEGHPDLLKWATVIGGKYMGADRAEGYGRRNAVPGELLVRVTPAKILARADIVG